MINFNDELKKYEPMLEINDIEDSIHSTDVKDIMDMLNYIVNSNNTKYTKRSATDDL